MKTTVSLTRAIRLLYTEKAEIVEAHDGVYIRSASGEDVWPMPKILRLIRHVKLAYDKIYGPPMVSKRGVLLRDNHTCAYCGATHANTVDHVLPRSRGGRSTWMNLVAACRECNNRKRDRTPEEAGMKLRVTPFEPKRKNFVL
jgi:5-methylcytosine-specific restriction endonuclease McrA